MPSPAIRLTSFLDKTLLTTLLALNLELGKYLITLSIWIANHTLVGNNLTKSGLETTLSSSLSYRWLNALTGSLILLVVAGIAYQLSHRRSYALIASLFVATDGLLLVESRYALINVYLLIFGFLGQWFFLLALKRPSERQKLWLALSGLCLGASVAVKWNGLGFLLGLYVLWISAWVIQLVQLVPTLKVRYETQADLSLNYNLTEAPLRSLTQFNLLHMLFYLGILPTLTYSLLWIPHLWINTTTGFWALHRQILNYHLVLGGNDSTIHPYCSAWYTWPLMARPVVYFSQTLDWLTNSTPSLLHLGADTGKVIYAVHAMGNPVLWWLSTAAVLLFVLLVFWMLAQRFWIWVTSVETKVNQLSVASVEPTESWIMFYVVVNYAANLLPWMTVTRCTFLYHYMSASIFSFLALAWIVERWLQSDQHLLRTTGVTVIALILLAFIFWMPIYLGLPLSPESFHLRMWFRSWI